MATNSSTGWSISRKGRRRKNKKMYANIRPFTHDADEKIDESHNYNERGSNSKINNKKQKRRNFQNKKKRFQNKQITIKVQCNVCLMKINDNNCINLVNCSHIICKECLHQYVQTNLKNISQYPMKCYHYNCDKLLHLNDIKNAFKLTKRIIKRRKKQNKILYRNDNESIKIFEKFSILCAIPDNQRIQCPKCKMIYWKELKNQTFGYCQDCRYRFCLKCSLNWHPGELCLNKEKSSNLLFIEQENEKLFRKRKWMMCPLCGIMIEKTYGCNSMIHKRCPKANNRNVKFCYCCGQRLSSERYDYNNNIHFNNGSSYDCNVITEKKRKKLQIEEVIQNTVMTHLRYFNRWCSWYFIIAIAFVFIAWGSYRYLYGEYQSETGSVGYIESEGVGGIVYEEGWTAWTWTKIQEVEETSEIEQECLFTINASHGYKYYQNDEYAPEYIDFQDDLYSDDVVFILLECIADRKHDYYPLPKTETAKILSKNLFNDAGFLTKLAGAVSLGDDVKWSYCLTFEETNLRYYNKSENARYWLFHIEIPNKWYYNIPYKFIEDAYIESNKCINYLNVSDRGTNIEIHKNMDNVTSCVVNSQIGDKLRVEYSVIIKNNENEIYYSPDRIFEFILGKEQVIGIWDKELQYMCTGEIRELQYNRFGVQTKWIVKLRAIENMFVTVYS